MLNFLNRKHNLIVLFTLIIISLSCWFYTIAGIGMNMSAWKMTLIDMNIKDFSNSMPMKQLENHNMNLSEMVFIFCMWVMMMIAMMLPSSIPYIMMFDKISFERKKNKYKYASTFYFIFSYLIVWVVFSLLASILHILLELYGILNISTLKVGNLFGSILFLFAGIYQMTPLKNACLRYCRNPIELFSTKKIYNNIDSISTGFQHGIFCVGCCWPLMLLLFYSGVMNVMWILGLSLYIIIEKYIIIGKKFNFFTGFILIFFGLRIFFVSF